MSTRRSGLGRGLGALIPTDVTAGAGSAFQEVPVGWVTANRYQPREHFDEDSLAGLTASIRELGVLQPLLVRATGTEQYELIAGERRWRAAKRAGLQTVPVIVREAGDVGALEQALVENLHREDLNALEEAAAYQQLIEDFSLSQEDVAKRVGKSRSAVANTLRLFQLPPSIQAMIADARITAGHARALLGTPDRAFQEKLAGEIVSDSLSVREVEARVKAHQADSDAGDDEPVAPEPAPKPAPTPGGTRREPGLVELEHLLSEHLSTRVTVTGGSGTVGKVVLEFADLEDLERIYTRIVGT
jgi:ParB family transcriptional regulator, chromosome partitioning protein